jgi:hypothetical protein
VFYVEACESGSMFDSLLADDLKSMYIKYNGTDEDEI